MTIWIITPQTTPQAGFWGETCREKINWKIAWNVRIKDNRTTQKGVIHLEIGLIYRNMSPESYSLKPNSEHWKFVFSTIKQFICLSKY